MDRPDSGDYAEYFGRYIGLVPDGDILTFLEVQERGFVAFLDGIPAARHTHGYQVGKWSLGEVVGHISDTERWFGARAMAFARCDPQALPGFDQDAYVAAANFNRRELTDLAAEFGAVRLANRLLFGSFDDADWARRGVASGNAFAVRSVPWILAGHVSHHRRVIEERYL